ncbi:Hypothetical predicted protein [Lynx pardinus]|uniref:Uncharacterized protein n=1 Tax=Lynx pardinus TaxID=191816 RepID=A0A485MRK8_LYNPA|nr:Hypothetical predicted protein [Lynx pardinus]
MAAVRTHPHPVRPALGRTSLDGPRPAPQPRRGGSLGQSAQATSPHSRADRGGSGSRCPQAPSHLPYHSIPPPRLHSRGLVSGAERSDAARRERGERPSSLSPSSSATAAALMPETELAGAARRSASPDAFSCVAPDRQPSKQAGGVGAPGRERARGAG